MSVEEGQLIAVVGQVGAGKSSLIQAILGEMHVVQGSAHLKVSIASDQLVDWATSEFLD